MTNCQPAGQVQNTGRLDLFGAFDEEARRGNFSVPYRQTQRDVYGESFNRSSLLSRILGNSESLYEDAFEARNFADPAERSFTDFVRTNTPQGARRVAGGAIESLLSGQGTGINNLEESGAFLDALTATSNIFGSGVGGAIRSRIPGIYDEISALDAQGAINSSSVASIIDEQLPFLRDRLNRAVSVGRGG